MSFVVRRFSDADVLAAVADTATATTLVTSEGRALTEVQLQLRNRSQPFMKVELPAGARIVSVDLAGQSAKPASGADGTRIPLMRAGLSTQRPYQVSFVYLHAGTPFAKKGDIQMALPKLDVPVGLVRWEVFVPEQYTARAIDGNVIDAHRYPISVAGGYRPVYGAYAPAGSATLLSPPGAMPGQIRGRVVAADGSVIAGATVSLRVGSYAVATSSGSDGGFLFSGVPHGQAEVSASLSGFATQRTSFAYDGSTQQIEFGLGVGSTSETVQVMAAPPTIDTSTVSRSQVNAGPSMNVINLQQRAAGVLPIRVDVPRAGTSHEFVKPLVVNDSPTVRLRYKRN
jgi:hypothetical protein